MSEKNTLEIYVTYHKLSKQSDEMVFDVFSIFKNHINSKTETAKTIDDLEMIGRRLCDQLFAECSDEIDELSQITYHSTVLFPDQLRRPIEKQILDGLDERCNQYIQKKKHKNI